MTMFGYARVTTHNETLDAQLAALKAAGCEEIFMDKIRGSRADRVELDRMLATIDGGDTLMVNSLDRLARSTRDLLNILDTLAKCGAAFRSLGDSWVDTTTPHGHLTLTVLGGLAEFERELLRSRTSVGRAQALARGQHMGRPSALTEHQRHLVVQALTAGTATQADLARQFNVSQSTISRLADKVFSASPSLSSSALDADTAHAVRDFMTRLDGKYQVIDGLLFGSRARGSHRPDSDVDIVVVLRGSPGNRYRVAGDLAEIAFDVMLETGVLVDPLPLWEQELEQPVLFNNSALIQNIKRDALRL